MVRTRLFAFAALGLLLAPAISYAQRQGGGNNFSGGGFSGGGMSGGGISGGGFSGGSASGSGFRPPGLSSPLNRGGSQDPFGAARGTPYLNQLGTTQMGSMLSGNQFQGMNRGMMGNRQMMGGGLMGANMSGGNQMGSGSRLQTSALPSSFRPIAPAFPEVEKRLGEILDQLSMPSEQRIITLDIDGGILVLRGEVLSEREKQLAETMLRLEPGVYEFRNELEVRPAPRRSTPPRPATKPTG